MSKFQLPTQKGTEIWPQVMRSMVMVRFEGIDAGTPLARELYARLQGPIDKFYRSQAQNYSLSPTTLAGKTIEDGDLKMTYINNMGQEIVKVRVATSVVEQVLEELEKPERKDLHPKLAIDVLFTPKEHLVGNISSYQQFEGTDPPLGDWWDPAYWTLLFESGSGDAFFDLYGSHGPPGYYWYVGAGVPGGPGSGGLPSNYVFVDLSDHDQPQLSSYIIYAAEGDGGTLMISESGWLIDVGGGGGGGGVDPYKLYVRDEYTYFSTLMVVAVQSDDASGDRAMSTGVSSGIIQSISGGALSTISRELVLGAEVLPGITGAGFLVELPYLDAEDHTFGVYIASMNITVSNAFPDAEGAVFGVDDPSFEYDVETEATFRIRAREYETFDTVTSVGVRVTSSRLHDHYATEVHDAPPETLSTSDEEPSGRDIGWGFAVTGDWISEGGEPARPDVPGMGTILDASGLTTRAVSGPPTAIPREIFDKAKWDYGIGSMTRVATIVWTPSVVPGEPGTAQIVLE